jgi:MFS superfamily sulfate permease-like transporter
LITAGNIARSSVIDFVWQCILLIPQTNLWAVLTFVLALVIHYIGSKFMPTIPRTSITAPWAAIMTILGVGVGWLLSVAVPDHPIETMGSRYGSFSISLIDAPTWDNKYLDLALIGYSVEIAFVCLLEAFTSSQMSYDVTGHEFCAGHIS